MSTRGGDLFFQLFQIVNSSDKAYSQMKGKFGESILKNHIESLQTIPGYYKVISNILLPIGKYHTQIDTIFIHQKGIFCIEYKNYNGWIFGSEKDKEWTQSLKKNEKYYFFNPVKQNATHCKALAKVLRTTTHNIESLVVFSDKSEFKVIRCPNVPVIHMSELESYLIKFCSVHEDRFTEKNVDAVYNLLELYRPTQEQLKEHIERVRKYKDGFECPKCSSELEMVKRMTAQGNPRYYLKCTNKDCPFERDAILAEVIKLGDENDQEWAFKKMSE